MVLILARAILAVLGLALMSLTFECVRRSRLRARYAVLWMFTGAVIVVCAIFRSVPGLLAKLLQCTFLDAASLIIFLFTMLVMFNLTIAISRVQADEQKTARRCALLEAELESLRRKIEAGGKAPTSKMTNDK